MDFKNATITYSILFEEGKFYTRPNCGFGCLRCKKTKPNLQGYRRHKTSLPIRNDG